MADPTLEPFPGDWQRALCVVAHPDDLEYGAASAVARWTTEGRSVGYVLATSGEAGIDAMSPDVARPLREAEQRASASEVGVEVVEFLGHPDGTIEYGLPLRRDLARVVRRHRPEVLISINFGLAWGSSPGGGGGTLNQADHRALGLALIDAARDAGNRWVFPELGEEGLEPWSGARFVAFAGSATPTHAVDVTGFLDRGIASLRAHRAYLNGLGDSSFDPEAFLTSSAAATGPALGVGHAVAFEVFSL